MPQLRGFRYSPSQNIKTDALFTKYLLFKDNNIDITEIILVLQAFTRQANKKNLNKNWQS